MKNTGGNSRFLAVLSAIAAIIVAYSVYLVIDYSNMESAGSSENDSLITERFASEKARNNYVDKEITDRMKPIEPLLDILAAYENELQSEYNEMKSELGKYDIEKILTMSIDFPDSISAASAKLAFIGSILKNYNKKFRDISNRTAVAVNSIKLKDISKQPLIDSIYLLIACGDNNINEFFLIQDSIIRHISKLQTFLSDNKGRYKLIEEEIKFISKKEQNVFTKYGNRLLELWQKEKEWIIRIKQQEGIVDEKIHTEIEKFLL